MHAQHFIEWTCEFLTQIIESIKDLLFGVHQQQLLLQIFVCELSICLRRFWLRYLKQLLEENDDELNHLLVLLSLILFLKAICQVLH